MTLILYKSERVTVVIFCLIVFILCMQYLLTGQRPGRVRLGGDTIFSFWFWALIAGGES